MFHEYRRQKKEGSKQRAVNFDWDVVDRVFPAAKDSDLVEMDLKYETDHGVAAIGELLTGRDTYHADMAVVDAQLALDVPGVRRVPLAKKCIP
jgi:hypothetical protein